MDGVNRNAFLVVVLVVATVGASVNIVRWLKGGHRTYSVILVDVEKKRIYKEQLKKNVYIEYPLKSPYTGRRTSYPAYKCLNCGEIFAFLPRFISTSKGGKAANLTIAELMDALRCPKCGSSLITVPDLPAGTQHLDVLQDKILIVEPKKR